MKRMIKGVGVLLALTLLAGCERAPTQTAAPAAGKTASANADRSKLVSAVDRPELRVKTLDGVMFDLAEQRGKWTLVNYWATWCGPCIQEMPELSALAAMREHIRVVGLAYDEASEDELRAFLKKHPVTYPIARIDVYEPPKDFGAPRGLPTSWLIAPDGQLARKYTGPLTASMLDEDIARFEAAKAK